jgi:hypothetical protein
MRSKLAFTVLRDEPLHTGFTMTTNRKNDPKDGIGREESIEAVNEVVKLRRETGTPNAADQRRQGNRRAAGADTPSGPKTDRTAQPAKRAKAEAEGEETERGLGASEDEVPS